MKIRTGPPPHSPSMPWHNHRKWLCSIMAQTQPTIRVATPNKDLSTSCAAHTAILVFFERARKAATHYKQPCRPVQLYSFKSLLTSTLLDKTKTILHKPSQTSTFIHKTHKSQSKWGILPALSLNLPILLIDLLTWFGIFKIYLIWSKASPWQSPTWSVGCQLPCEQQGPLLA